jgi:hypothetical protein
MTVPLECYRPIIATCSAAAERRDYPQEVANKDHEVRRAPSFFSVAEVAQSTLESAKRG